MLIYPRPINSQDELVLEIFPDQSKQHERKSNVLRMKACLRWYFLNGNLKKERKERRLKIVDRSGMHMEHENRCYFEHDVPVFDLCARWCTQGRRTSSRSSRTLDPDLTTASQECRADVRLWTRDNLKFKDFVKINPTVQRFCSSMSFQAIIVNLCIKLLILGVDIDPFQRGLLRKCDKSKMDSLSKGKQVSISSTLNAQILRMNVLSYVCQSRNVTRKAAKTNVRTKDARV
jgi:hypothetical protein